MRQLLECGSLLRLAHLWRSPTGRVQDDGISRFL